MNLAVAAPGPPAYSETFIEMQFRRLPCRLRIYGRPYPSETVPGGRIGLRSLRGVADLVREARWGAVRREGGSSCREGGRRRELERRLRRAGIDAVLVNYGPTAVGLLPACRNLKIPVAVHFHGYDAHMEAVVKQYRAFYRQLGSAAGAIVAVSRVMAQALESYGVPKEKIHLVRVGCDVNRFEERQDVPERPTFFGVGRFVEKKAPHLTVLAFRAVIREFPDARLILGGDGPLLEVAQSLARALGLGAAVEFPGVLAPDQVARYMRAATAFVQHSAVPMSGPSRGDSEGTPVAVLEAMASGLPVVATRHAGIGEVVEHERMGLLVEEYDVDGMAQAMLRLAAAPDLARSLGHAARREVLAKYTASHYIESLKQVLVSIT